MQNLTLCLKSACFFLIGLVKFPKKTGNKSTTHPKHLQGGPEGGAVEVVGGECALSPWVVLLILPVNLILRGKCMIPALQHESLP